MFDFEESGDGPALLFVPGAYSTAAAWRGVVGALQGRYRTILTSLPGYGGSSDPRELDDPAPGLIGDFLAAVVDRIGAPVHLVGHSFGGLCVLSGVLSGAVRPLSLITFEANPVYGRWPGGPRPWRAELDVMLRRFEAAIEAGDPDAPGIVIDYWSALGTFAAMPAAFQAHCRAKVATNRLDMRQGAAFRPEAADYARLTMSCTIARGGLAIAPITDIADTIVANAPDARLHVEDGAGHFLISTHPAACAAVIDAHMARIGGV